MLTKSFQHQRSLFHNYQCLPGCFDEFFTEQGEVHPEIQSWVERISRITPNEIKKCQQQAGAIFRVGGVTFSLNTDGKFHERIMPLDLIPRIITAREWQTLSVGLTQRVKALNAFLNDVYGRQQIIHEGIVPRYVVESSPGFIPWLRGITPPNKIYIHIGGIDIVRGEHGEFVVLEDNVRTPSGVSYTMENREIMQRLFPDIFTGANIHSVQDYPQQLKAALNEIAPEHHTPGLTVVLTPGPFNSAYFEHIYLAQKMGCELVLGQDLFVENKHVYLKTISGPKRVDAIYKRIDDDFIDPKAFRADSELGVPGLMEAYMAGNVVLANGIGNGVADDKAIYPYIPAMIRFYLNEEPKLAQVETYSCLDPKSREYVIKNINKLVVKMTDASGGHGMLIGPQASAAECKVFCERINAEPRHYIAQPLLELSSTPTYCKGKIEPRRVDFRPFVITGKNTWIMPGGLSRVALAKDSYVVNSCQGGGAKDTWILGDDSRC